MKFSVVIPCHDRLELLREAIYTVFQQKWIDWELIIFDNASKSELAQYVLGLGDSRVKYARSDEFLPVTDSWNRAIDMATGEYIVFLGDDDGLTPNYFSRITSQLEKFGNPEIVYTAIYQFLYPGVAPWALGGYVADVKNGFFFVGKNEPFLLSSKQALKAVKGSVSLRRNFTFNIQAFAFSRTFIHRLKQDGPFFRSSFPDYYIANIALATSQSILVIPEPMCIAGVSKSSVGYALFNGLEEKFAELLNTNLSSDPFYNTIGQFLLPGPLYNTNYVMAMEYVVRFAYPFIRQQVNFGRYRRLQIYHTILNRRSQGKNWKNPTLWNQLNLREKFWTLKLLVLLKIKDKNKVFSFFVGKILNRMLNPHAFIAITRICNENDYQQLANIFDALHSGALK